MFLPGGVFSEKNHDNLNTRDDNKPCFTGGVDSLTGERLSGSEVIENLSLFVEAHTNISQSFVCLNMVEIIIIGEKFSFAINLKVFHVTTRPGF